MTTAFVAGAIANKPGNGGEAWVRVNWVRGLRRLGVDAWFVEELSPAAWGAEVDACTAWFCRVVERFGLADGATLVDVDSGEIIAGPLPPDGADLLVNISGHARRHPFVTSSRRRAYVDLDPGYTQIWHEQGADLGLDGHDAHFTVGLNVGTPRSTIPHAGRQWHSVLPPVLLDEWVTDAPDADAPFTTVASWRGGYGPVEHDGVRHGVKAHEFRRFIELPRHVTAPLELALDIHPADAADRHRLEANGWRVVDPRQVAGDTDGFRDYVRGSLAELSVAQGVYAGTASGWFSDRTAHYLAAGRAALVQDTGIGAVLPTGDGLLTFTSLAEAATGAADLLARRTHHSESARCFAEAHLDADRVLARFLDQVGA